MAESVSVIIQLPLGSAIDRQLTEDPPPGVASGRAVIERIDADAEGRIAAPAGGEVVLSFLSPEALRREAEQVGREINGADNGAPPVVVLEMAEYLREDELAALLQAAERASRTVILCILSGI